ncbi:MAG: glycohydrolase toxin TNT-related protein [Enterobacteriaceae bacterium]
MTIDKIPGYSSTANVYESKTSATDKADKNLLNALQKWADSAPPGSGELRDVAMERLLHSMEKEQTSLSLADLNLTTLPDLLPPGITHLNIDNNRISMFPSSILDQLLEVSALNNNIVQSPTRPVDKNNIFSELLVNETPANIGQKFFTETGEIIWPENDGFDGPTIPSTLRKGDTIDRYGFEFGKFTAPVGSSFTSRALPNDSLEKPYTISYVGT